MRKINQLFLSLYLTFVWGAYIFVKITDEFFHIVLLIIPLFFISYWFVSKIVLGIEAIELHSPVLNKQKVRIAFWVSASVCFVIMLLWYVAYYPGAFSPDSLNQYLQAVSGTYNDWHPVWHTLLFFSLPLKLTGGRCASVIFFQILYFSLTMGYIAMVIYKCAGLKAMAVTVALIILNPCTTTIMLYPWKDVAFALSGAVAMAISTELYFKQNRDWESKKCHFIVLGLFLANTTLFRRNAILFTFPLLVALFFYMSKRYWFGMVCIFLITLFLIKVPLYQSLNVEKPDDRVSEIAGLPLTIIGNAVKETPEKLDKETQNYVYAIASPEQWEDYVCGDFNSIKWDVNLSVVNEKGVAYVLHIMWKCIQNSTKESLKGFFSLTDLVYGIDATDEMIIPKISENDYGIELHGSKELQEFLEDYCSLFDKHSFMKYMRNIGAVIFIILIFTFSGLEWREKESLKTLLLSLPLLIYNFGTMLLLTGDDFRFFYITFLLCPMLVVIMLYRNQMCKEKVKKQEN